MPDRPDTYWLVRANRLEAAIRYHQQVKQASKAPFDLPDISDDYDRSLWRALDGITERPAR